MPEKKKKPKNKIVEGTVLWEISKKQTNKLPSFVDFRSYEHKQQHIISKYCVLLRAVV
jgi:hypothetical protein